jgi:hypothetical protein
LTADERTKGSAPNGSMHYQNSISSWFPPESNFDLLLSFPITWTVTHFQMICYLFLFPEFGLHSGPEFIQPYEHSIRIYTYRVRHWNLTIIKLVPIYEPSGFLAGNYKLLHWKHNYMKIHITRYDMPQYHWACDEELYTDGCLLRVLPT